VEGLGRFGAAAASSGSPAPAAPRRVRRGPGWERRLAEALDQLASVLVGPQLAPRPIPISR